MALIPDLPAASGLSASNLFIIDTGSTTQKLPVSAAYASGSAPGFVSTGDQTFAGDKVFNDRIAIHSSNETPQIDFASKIYDKSTRNGLIYLNTPLLGSNYRTDRFYFIEYSYDSSDGTPSTYKEHYTLPAVTADRTSHGTYNILTDKTVEITSAVHSTISSGTNHVYTLSNNAHGILILTALRDTARAMYIFNVSSAGDVTLTPILAPTTATVTTGTNTITVANSSGAGVYPMFLLFNGTVTA